MNALDYIRRAESRSALFCGEHIIDVYHYCHPLGKPTKDAIVSVEADGFEEFNGGVIAAAAHAQQISEFIEVCSGGLMIRKERYVESQHVRKLFEVYRLAGELSHPIRPLQLYDAVVVMDYGHGFVTKDFLEELGNANYLAVNVQTNSGNYGFNLATKYGYADYLCVDEPEARLATQNRSGPIEESLSGLRKIAPKVVITLGKAGAIGCSDEGVIRSPAFTDAVVDTIGAGDAFFAVSALVAHEADLVSLLRIGNAAGAIKAGIVGHRNPIRKGALYEQLARVCA